MCLGIPGKIVRIDESPIGIPTGRVDFGGVSREVCLAYVPDAVVGDYVIVHVGFAISRVNEEEARRTYEVLREMNRLDELEAIRDAIADAERDPDPGPAFGMVLGGAPGAAGERGPAA